MMRCLPVVLLLVIAVITGCSKKHQPQLATAGGATSAGTKSPANEKKATVKIPVAKVITVDDRAAKRTPDGRLYYDLGGKRYWKNYDDGKYYIFNRKMYGNPAFKPH